jgi:nucleoside-diphosphate-sugar epimerase
MEKILVIGGAGYIGTVLVPRLLKEGYSVRVLDKLFFGNKGLKSILNQIELIVDDTRMVDVSVFEGIDVVIDIGGLSNDPTAEFNPEANRAVNTEAVARMGSMSKQMGVKRYVFGSSCSIYYTETPNDELRNENYPVNPTAPYSLSKYNAEGELKKLKSDHFCPIMLRKGTVYGSSPRMRYDLVVNAFVKSAYLNGRLNLHLGGRMWRPLIHINDVVEGYIACLRAKKEDVSGRVINLLSTNLTVKQVANETKFTLEKDHNVHINLELQEVGIARSYRVDDSLCKELLKFTPKYNISDAVDVMWDELASGIDPNEPIFYNILWLELLCDMEKRINKMGGFVL